MQRDRSPEPRGRSRKRGSARPRSPGDAGRGRPRPRHPGAPAGERVGRYRRVVTAGLLLSLLAHALLFLLWRGASPVPGALSAGRAPAAGSRPGAGAEALRAVRLRASEPTRIPSPPPPVRPVEAEVREIAPSAEAPLAAAELEAHVASPPGTGDAPPGAGTRSGQGAGEAGRGLSPPVPRSVLPEWDPPPEVRGRSVTVRVRVDARGRPSGPVELDPPTPDDAFNRRLARKVRSMEFRPARLDGRPVAAWAELTFVF